MSKGNMFLGYARGKVGSVVFSRANGQQITRAKADKVSNPRTDAQLLQRIIINTASAAYSVLSPICDHSFQGKQRGQQCMSEFMKKNADMLRNLVVEDGLSAKSFRYLGAPAGLNVNPYVVSSGTLPGIPAVVGSSAVSINVAIPNTHTLATMTYQDLIDMLGAKRGDQLTVLAFVGISGDGAAEFWYERVILDPRESDGTAADLSTLLVTGTGAAATFTKANPRNEKKGNLTIGGASGKFGFTNSDGDLTMGCFILSRKEKNAWKRSAATFVVDADYDEGPQDATMQDAINAAVSGGIDMGSSIYLNNATNG